MSRASARQRAGRAGRVRLGHCWRLYSRDFFEGPEVEAKVDVNANAQIEVQVVTEPVVAEPDFVGDARASDRVDCTLVQENSKVKKGRVKVGRGGESKAEMRPVATVASMTATASSGPAATAATVVTAATSSATVASAAASEHIASFVVRMSAYSLPEIQRVPLEDVILQVGRVISPNQRIHLQIREFIRTSNKLQIDTIIISRFTIYRPHTIIISVPY